MCIRDRCWVCLGARYVSNPQPAGIAYFNQRLYVVDFTLQHCYVYEANLSGTLLDEGFALDELNATPRGIEYYNNRLYVSNSRSPKIFVYTVDGNRRPNEDIGLDENNNNIGDIAYYNKQLWTLDTLQQIFSYSTLTTGDPLILPLTNTARTFDGMVLSEADKRPNNWYELWYVDIARSGTSVGKSFIRGFRTDITGVPLVGGDGYNSELNIAFFDQPLELQIRDTYELTEYKLLPTTPEDLLDGQDPVNIQVVEPVPEE